MADAVAQIRAPGRAGVHGGGQIRRIEDRAIAEQGGDASDAASSRRGGDQRRQSAGRDARRSTAPGCWFFSARATTAATRCSPPRGWPGGGPRSPRCAASARRTRPDSRRCWPPADDSSTSTRGAYDLTRTDLALDGVLGIGGRPGLPGRARPAGRRPRPGAGARDRGRHALRRGGRHRRSAGTVGARGAHGHLRRTEGLPPARAGSQPVRGGHADRYRAGFRHRAARLTPGDTDRTIWRGWPYPGERSDKYSRGVVGMDTGSKEYPGRRSRCPRRGVRRGGHGPIPRRGTPGGNHRGQLPHVVFSPGRVQAWLFGSGWGDRADGAGVPARPPQGLPAVVDADGLRYLPDRTPPPGCSPRTPGSWPHCWPRAPRVRMIRCARSAKAPPHRRDGAAQRRQPTGGLAPDAGPVELPSRPGMDRPGRLRRRAGRGVRRAAGSRGRLGRPGCWARRSRRSPPRSTRARCHRPTSPGLRGPARRWWQRQREARVTGQQRRGARASTRPRSAPTSISPPSAPTLRRWRACRGPRSDGGGQGRRLRPRDAGLRARSAGRRRELARRGHARRGAGPP